MAEQNDRLTDELEYEYPLEAPYSLEGIPVEEVEGDELDVEEVVADLNTFVSEADVGRGEGADAESLVGVARAGENAHGTWGTIWVWNGSKWVRRGFTLEPRSSVGKGPIPLGVYRFRRWVSKKLGKTLRLANVPGFTDILVHVGNVQSETAGCILAAKKVDSTKNPRRLIDSRSLTDWLYDNCPAGRIKIINV
ncbi:MAG: hypothetical protein GKS06_11190 [Acidobacteria bacterium]|nr:hypothetical protein [Acidobacteriota bacterium]